MQNIMKKNLHKKNDLRAEKILVNLNREQFEFLTKIGLDALFTTGKKLTNNKILITFIDALRELKINGEGVDSCEKLKKKILAVLKINSERRSYPRFKKDVKIFSRKLESLEKYEECHTIDIGEGGFRIELKEERKIGEVLEFTIVDSCMPENPITAFGRIVWVKRRSDNDVLEVGIKLTGLIPNEKDRFKRLLNDENVE